MTLRNDNLIAADGAQNLAFWSPAAESRRTLTFGTGATGCFVPSFAYHLGQSIAETYPAPPIAPASRHGERCP